MPRFSLPGHAGPQTLVLTESHRVHRFPLPYSTDDPVECELLRSYPGIVETVPKPVPAPAKTEPRKEV